jgi:hypothetical protein
MMDKSEKKKNAAKNQRIGFRHTPWLIFISTTATQGTAMTSSTSR